MLGPAALINRKHKVESLKARLALSQNVRPSLAEDFETDFLTDEERSEAICRRDESLKQSHILAACDRPPGKAREGRTNVLLKLPPLSPVRKVLTPATW